MQNSTGQLTSNSGATWRFNTLQQPPTASISYGQLLHTPYVQNADCIFTSVSSNYSTVDVFLSSLLGINKTTDINTVSHLSMLRLSYLITDQTCSFRVVLAGNES